jgi:hypothetical protein
MHVLCLWLSFFLFCTSHHFLCSHATCDFLHISWVTASIVLAPDDETRLARLTKMIDLARRFLDLDNYNGLAAVFAGLQSSPVHRLTRTLERLAPDARAALAAVTDVMRQDANYKRLRRRIRKAPGPCIPYLGIVVRDMVIMMEAHDTYIDEACVCRRVTPLFFFFFFFFFFWGQQGARPPRFFV